MIDLFPMQTNGLDQNTIQILNDEFSGSPERSARPLRSVLLMAKSLNISAHESLIRSFYNSFHEKKKVQDLRQKITEEYAETLSQFPDFLQELNAPSTFEELSFIEKKLKRRHRSKAAHARKQGFEAPFQLVWDTLHGKASQDWSELLTSLVKEESEDLNSKEKILQMLAALLSEKILEDAKLENSLKKSFFDNAFIRSSKSEKAAEDSKFKSFFNFEAPYSKLLRNDHAHRFLSLRRGVSQGELLMSVEAPLGSIEAQIYEFVAPMAQRSSLNQELLDWAFTVGSETLKSQIIPHFQKEAFNELRKNAEEEVLPPIRRNLRRVLMSPGIGRQVVMGVSPSGKKTCRIAVVDREGNFKETALLHLMEDEKKSETEAVFLAFIEKHQVQAIALSDHSGAREIERFLQDLFRSVKLRLPICLLPAEAADDYASSKLAQDEFPEIETANRKAIFIARQLQNPLGEFVKIKPKSLGVGQFLAEIHPESLNQTLEEVILDCVHEVGVDLNSASKVLLSKVSGLNEELAAKLVQYRNEKGFFWDRDQILEVEGITPEVLDYCGPFLRIRDGKNPLDLSFAHPKYNKNILEALKRLKIEKSEWTLKADLLLNDEKLVAQLGSELVTELVALIKDPPKDPRGEFKFIQFREDVKDVRDLKVGMVCPGRVSNVTSFGAFVDIGIQQDGLVHLSEMSSSFVKDPFDVIHPGDLVTIKVLAVDADKKQISFTMKNLSGFSEKNQEIDKRQREAVARQALVQQEVRPPRPARPQSPRPQNRPENVGRDENRPARQDARPSRPTRNEGFGDRNQTRPPRPQGPRDDFKPSRPPQDRSKERSNAPRKPSTVEGLRDNPFAALAGLRDQLKR